MGNLFAIILICAAVWWFWQRLPKKGNHPEKNRAPVLVDAKYGVYIRPDSEDEQRIAALHREATEHKNNGEWDKAIACLREAEALKPKVITKYPVKHSLRLPLFLQQAGHFEQAMIEFQDLIDDTENRVSSWLPKRNISSKKMFIHADLHDIYSSMATACKREKQFELAEKYSTLSQQHKEKHALLLKRDLQRDAKKFVKNEKK